MQGDLGAGRKVILQLVDVEIIPQVGNGNEHASALGLAGLDDDFVGHQKTGEKSDAKLTDKAEIDARSLTGTANFG